jgi:hypothetical protein
MDNDLPAFTTADFEAMKARLLAEDPAELWETTVDGVRRRLSAEEVHVFMVEYRQLMAEPELP